MLVNSMFTKEHKKVIDDIYRNIVISNNELFFVDTDNQIESAISKIIKNNRIEESINEIQVEFANEIKNHHSYPYKKHEWAIIYQIIQKLVAQLEHKAQIDQYNQENKEEYHEEEQDILYDENHLAKDEDAQKVIESITEKFTYTSQIKSFFKCLLEENEKFKNHYYLAKNSYSKFKIILGRLKSWIRELSAFLGIDCIFVLLARLMERSKFLDIFVKIVGTVFSIGLAMLALLLTFLRWLQNPIERILRSLAKLLGIKPPDDDDSGLA